MRTKLIERTVERAGFSADRTGHTERYVYECPCGKGTVVEEHDDVPGFREHDVELMCPICKQKYKIDISKGKSAWELVAL